MQDIALTNKERHQLLSVLRELDDQAPSENRASPRRKVQLNIWIRMLGRLYDRLPATMVNVAAKGVGLHVEHPIKPGQKFLLNLRFVEGGGWLVLCEARNARPLRMAFKVGAAFLDRIDDPDGNAKPPLDWLL